MVKVTGLLSCSGIAGECGLPVRGVELQSSLGDRMEGALCLDSHPSAILLSVSRTWSTVGRSSDFSFQQDSVISQSSSV